MRLFVIASCLVMFFPEVASAQSEEACFPTCREGYLCHEGSCVEACNPPCGSGTTCSASGACEADAGPSSSEGSDPGSDSAAASAGGTYAVGESGFAIGGAVLGVVMTALSIGLYATVGVAQLNYYVEVGLLWGAVGLPFITAPMVGGGALSASGPGAEGFLPLRVGAWIAYGLYFIAVAGTSIHSAQNSGAIPDELAYALAVGGVATELAFVADALYTASQASSVPSSAAPVASLVTSPDGVDGAVLGVVGVF